MQSHNLMPSVIHRDIKPSNIMRKEDGSLVLIDFGSVKDVMRDKNATISGTMGFMAPEQLMGEPVIASDFYSLGATLLVLLSRKELEEMVENGIDLNWKSSVHVSNKMTHLLERLLDKDPKKRLNTLAELKDILLTDKYNKKELIAINKKEKLNENKIINKIESSSLEFVENQASDFSDEDEYINPYYASFIVRYGDSSSKVLALLIVIITMIILTILILIIEGLN